MLVAYVLPPDTDRLLSLARRQILLITARDCNVIVTTQDLIWSLASWKNKWGLTHRSSAFAFIVVLGCEMHLCCDCFSKDITHLFWISRRCLVCFMYLYARYWKCDGIEWLLLAGFPYLSCKGMNTEEKMFCLQAWTAWERGKDQPVLCVQRAGSDLDEVLGDVSVPFTCARAAASPECRVWKGDWGLQCDPCSFWSIELFRCKLSILFQWCYPAIT